MPTLTIRRGAVYSYIVEPLPFQVKKEISKQLSYIKDGWQFTPSGKAGNWDGKVTLFNKTTYGPAQAYPSGLESTVLEVLASYNCPVTIVPVDKYSPAESLGIEPSDDIVLRDYQNEAIDVALSRKRMIINLPTGSGKTVTSGEFIRQVNQKPTLFCVYHSKELLTQTIRNFNQQLGCSIGKIGNGAFELDDITVAITDSLATAIKKRDIKTLDYLKSVKCIIFDEVHHARAETVQAIAKACPNAEYRIGLSGTPARDSGDDLEIVAYIGPIAYEKSITWMVEHGYLVRPVIYYVKLRGNSSRFDNYRDLMSTYICDNPERDKFIAFLAKQLESKGHRGLVLAEQVNHGEALSKLIPGADFIHGGDSASYRQAVIDDLTNNQTNTVVATSIIREGVDIPPASYLIHAHPFKSFVVTWQRNGRVLRPFPGKEKAVIVDIVDTGNKWLPAHGARRLKYYRQEPCFDIKEREATLKA